MRRTEKIMREWLFTYKDGEKTMLDLPHTWNALDGQDGGDDYFKGTCIYEKTVKKPEFSADERVYLQFHGVNASAKVIFNGETVCVRDGGYSTFRMNVTELLKEDNHILVEVDNSVNDRVYPQKADFTFYCGIYRDVEFLIVSKEHFDLDYFGGPGMKYDTDVDGKDAKVHVCAYTNEAAKAAGAVTKVTLLDAEGKMVAEAEGNEVVLNVKNVHLWDGLADPYLYTLKASLEVNAKVAFLYGPGANTHRTPYGGRNFEYYSEDSVLSSEIGKAEVKGIEDKGVFVVMKHFALNDSEQDRIGLGAWLNEQSAREIYLRAFQGALEDSQAGGNGVMMAYTRLGGQ